jgi:hypothetical protein
MTVGQNKGKMMLILATQKGTTSFFKPHSQYYIQIQHLLFPVVMLRHKA